MRAWAVDAAALRAERLRISSTSTRVKSSRWAVFTAQQVNPFEQLASSPLKPEPRVD